MNNIMKQEFSKMRILFLLPTFNIISPGRGVLTLTKSLDRQKILPIICSIRQADAEAKREAEKIGIRVIELKSNCLLNIFTVFKLRKILKDYEIDIIHTFGARAEILGAIVVRMTKNVKMISTILHNPLEDIILDYGLVKGKLINFLRKIFLKFGRSTIVAISNNAKKGLIGLGINEDGIRVIYSGIDEGLLKKEHEKFQINKSNLSNKFKNNDFIVATVAVLNARKGIYYLIEAAKKLVENHPDIKFLIIGSGPLEKKLKENVNTLGLYNHVIFEKYYENIAEIYQNINLFVLPSLTEGIPAVLLEAMAFGVPIVATSVGGVPEMIEDGISGVLVPPKDSEALAEGVIKVYKNSVFASEISKNARSRFEKYFTADVMACQYEKVYEELLEK